MYNNGEIRSNALRLVKQNLGKLVGLLLLPMVVVMLIGAFLIAFANSFGMVMLYFVAMLLILPALTMGGVRALIGIWQGEDVRIRQIFYYCTEPRRYGKSLLLAILLYIITLVVVLIPFVGVFIAYWLQMRLFLSVWLFVNDERLSVVECIKFSFERMKGHCWRYFCMLFMVSIIWVGVCFAIFIPTMIITQFISPGIGLFLNVILIVATYVLYVPFMTMSMAGFAAELLPTAYSTHQDSTGPELA